MDTTNETIPNCTTAFETKGTSPNTREHLSEVLTAEDLAELLHISRKTVYNAFKRGDIPGGRKIGATLRFSRDRVLKWLFEGQERSPRSQRGSR